MAVLADVSFPSQACGGSASARARLVLRMAREVPQMIVVAGAGRQRPERGRSALDAYEGPCFGALRERVGSSLPHRLRVFVLSTRHGLLGANERLGPCISPPANPDQVRARIRRRFHAYLGVCPVEEVLLLLPTNYLDVLPRVTGHAGLVHTIVDPVRDWPRAAGILDRWGWP